MTIRGKTWQAQLGNCQNWNSHISKIVCLLPVCLINDWHLGDHISEPYKVLWKTVNNCARNRSRSDEIDIQTEICTSLKYKFYFLFRWPSSTKSTLISYISVRVFCDDSWENNVHHNRKTEKIGILHTLKIGYLLPVCLRNNRHLALWPYMVMIWVICKFKRD